jgi:starch synthase (maltosyl-transferring)
MHPLWSPFNRIVIENVQPELDGGRYPVKRVVGDEIEIQADIFRDGHDVVVAVVKYRATDEKDWREAPLRFFYDDDRWVGRFPLDRNIRFLYTVEAWTDLYQSWRQDFEKKRNAKQDIALELTEGRDIIVAAAKRAQQAGDGALRQIVEQFDATANIGERDAILAAPPVGELVARWGERADRSTYHRELEVIVDRPQARYAAWYEMFARSQGSEPGRSATFDDCIRRLPEIHDMGFDVIYLLPIHPIGRVNRKGPNNTLGAKPGDPGSPYAIGSTEGGHCAIHPDLGTIEDFRRFVAACDALNMDVALDFAIQCAPDHPWIAQHPEWFTFRPDGTIKHAENPPKKYQDIVLPNFYGPHREALWRELRDVILFWIGQGVKIFRVDNPHTKPVTFWEWLIGEVQREHPHVVFLSEAFTRPKMLKVLAKAGFSQSYSYFTWRNFKAELIEYLTELTRSECKEYLRPNFFTSTPDILPPFLQEGGRPAFQVRLVLAATLSSVYGIYNGFELCENQAIPGTEEYAASEKYQYKVWDWDRPGNIKDYIRRVNAIRRDNPALREFINLRFYGADNDNVLFFGKRTADGSNLVFVAVNLDPFEVHDVTLDFPRDLMEIGEGDAFEVEELLTGVKHLWRGEHQKIRLDPRVNPAAIFRAKVWRHVDFRTPNP